MAADRRAVTYFGIGKIPGAIALPKVILGATYPLKQFDQVTVNVKVANILNQGLHMNVILHKNSEPIKHIEVAFRGPAAQIL